MPPAILLTLVACALCTCLTPLVRDACLRHNVIDLPDFNRKRHKRAVPRLGGIAIVSSYVVSLLLGQLYLARSPVVFGGSEPAALATLVPVILIFLVGLYDDLHGLTAVRKLFFQILVALAAVLAGFRFSSANAHVAPVMFVLSIFWLVACMNAFNLIDGLDGLASGVGALMAASCAFAGFLINDFGLTMAALILCGTLVGFLWYNINPASIFLGDSGSLTLGVVLGCVSMLWSNHASSFGARLAPTLIWTVPFLDLVLSVLRRAIRGVPLFSADRGHIHHQLVDQGFSTNRAAANLCVATAFGGVAAIIGCFAVGSLASVFPSILGIGVIWGVWKLRYAEFGALSSLFRQISLRKMTHAHITLTNFKLALSKADDVEEYYKLLKTVCREFGCCHLQLVLNGRVFKEELQARSLHLYWTLTFPLSGRDSLTIRTAMTLKLRSPSFLLFLEAVQNDLTARYQRRRTISAAATLPAVKARSLAANS